MSNFTPINPKKINKSSSKKKFNFLLWGNLILVVLIAVVGLVYYNQTLQTTKQKAAETPTPLPTLACGTIQCQLGSTLCQQDSSGKNTGYLCGCIDLSRGINCLVKVWRCTNWNPDKCPTERKEGEEKGSCPDLKVEGNCVKKKDGTSFTAMHYFCPDMTSGGNGCQLNGVLKQNVRSICFEYDCGTEQIDIFNTTCFRSRVGSKPCSDSSTTSTPTPTPTPTPTNRPTNTPTPTPTNQPTNTPTPTLTTLPTNTPTIPPTNTPPNNPSSTPTEIILVQTTNTPIQSSPTSTPPQQIAQTGDLRSSWVFAVPIGVILLGLLL